MAKKQLIRLTEGDLHKIIKESVNKVLKEFYHPEDIYGPDVHSWDGNPHQEFYDSQRAKAEKEEYESIANGDYDHFLHDEEWMNDLPRQKYYRARERKRMIDPNYALHDNEDDLEYFQKGQRSGKYRQMDNDWRELEDKKSMQHAKDMLSFLPRAFTEPLHTKGSLNRELRAMDKAKK